MIDARRLFQPALVFLRNARENLSLDGLNGGSDFRQRVSDEKLSNDAMTLAGEMAEQLAQFEVSDLEDLFKL
ncbi:MAG: hypothetical protein Q8P92_05985, partial [Candidatus Daviesbacteria bacterium]|nr:hypothetical protein [Candidatus Daviesbacteria bacterium]